MPTKSEIAQKVLNAKNGAQDEIRRAYLKDLSGFPANVNFCITA